MDTVDNARSTAKEKTQRKFRSEHETNALFSVGIDILLGVAIDKEFGLMTRYKTLETRTGKKLIN